MVIQNSTAVLFFPVSVSTVESATLALFAAECVCYLLQLVFGIYFVLKIRKISLLHINLRIILVRDASKQERRKAQTFQGNLPIQFTLFGGGRVGDTYTRTLLHQDSAVLRNSLCLVWKTMSEMGLPLCAFFFFMVAIERTCATMAIRTYEKKDKRIGATIITAAVSSILVNGDTTFL